ncbi:hypothetical protein [Segatella bryantii]|uniref:hypothetical protein n=1 Tax=Segatella bryantii TaxID=77095 RepID=UPI00242A92B2|nr:hypothetical protein [Segatella bryantii]
MKKIPTLFERVFENHHIKEILPNVTPGMEFVLEGKGVATVKYDGSCCAIIDGKFYVRYDARKGKPIPENAIKCQDEADPITGHLPCWIPYDETNPAHKWFGKALKNSVALDSTLLEDGTYEAIGPHFNGNMYNLEDDTLIKHGVHVIDVPRTFEGIRDYLKDNYIEGIVFWLDGEPKCKIKRTDFGFSWHPKKRK